MRTHDEEILNEWVGPLDRQPYPGCWEVSESYLLSLIEQVRADERSMSKRRLGSTLNVTYMAVVDRIKAGSHDGPMTEQQAAMRDGAHLMFKAIHERLAADLLRSQPVVLTLEQLEALPVKSAVIDGIRDIWQKFVTADLSGRWCLDGTQLTSSELLNDCGPIRLIYRAGDGR